MKWKILILIETHCFLSPLWEGPHHLFPGSSCLSARVNSRSSISRWQRIKSSPKDSLCGCVAHHPRLHTSRVGWQGPWLGRAGCSDLPQSWCCSSAGIWHPLLSWLGTLGSPYHCLPWHGPRGLWCPPGALGRGTTGWRGLTALRLVPAINVTQKSVPPLTEAPCRCCSLQHKASLPGEQAV